MNNSNFRLIIKQENIAAWAAINNTFAHPEETGNYGNWYWTGVLFQLGTFTHQGDIRYESNKQIEVDGTLMLDSAGLEDKRTWVDIRPVGSPDGDPPMALKDFYRAFPSEERPWSLHHYLDPYPGGIIVWDVNGFTLSVEKGSGAAGDEAYHRKYTFTFPGEYRYRIHQEGTWIVGDETNFDGVKEVTLSAKKISPPGQNMNPPQKP